jgi:hypothetical protein
MDSTGDTVRQPSPRLVVATRLAVAILQGIVLFALYRQLQGKAWPATDGTVFAPTLACAVFVPLIAIAGIANLRLRTLALWLTAALILCAGLSLYDVYQFPLDHSTWPAKPMLFPRLATWLCLAAVVFIVHSLIVAGDLQRRYIAGYAAYHDVSWTLAIQHARAAVFVGIFWGILWLGADMFRLIRIEFLAELIRKDWFFIPVTTLALASAIHLTDMRTSMVRGARTLELSLLAWLLPVIALIALGFLVALLFTGLQPLWDTRRATAILLIAAATIVVLVNAAYQGDRTETGMARTLHYARLGAIAAMVPLIALAAVGLSLRIEQYGLTPARIAVIACIFVAACYAAGYALAAARSHFDLRVFETTNVIIAFIVVGVLLALFSPIADPARISVASQMARLESGRADADKFDFAFLHFHSGRYGEAALETLKKKTGSPEAERIAARASEALGWKTTYDARRHTTVSIHQLPATSTPKSRAENIAVVYPAGGTVPASFIAQEWDSMQQLWLLPTCLQNERGKCNAIIADIDGDDTPEILLFTTPLGTGAAFKAQTGGGWAFIGGIQNASCAGVQSAIGAGKFELVTPVNKQIRAGEQTLNIYKPCVPVRP